MPRTPARRWPTPAPLIQRCLSASAYQRSALRPPRHRELDAPRRSFQEHRTLDLHEAGRRGRREPVAEIGRILADQCGDDAGEALEIHLHEIARGGARDVADAV